MTGYVCKEKLCVQDACVYYLRKYMTGSVYYETLETAVVVLTGALILEDWLNQTLTDI